MSCTAAQQQRSLDMASRHFTVVLACNTCNQSHDICYSQNSSHNIKVRKWSHQTYKPAWPKYKKLNQPRRLYSIPALNTSRLLNFMQGISNDCLIFHTRAMAVTVVQLPFAEDLIKFFSGLQNASFLDALISIR